jgi:predicted O-linked N-acetylglucosamine transferase (SPINDLY family)
VALMDAKRLDEALSACQAAVQLAPDYAQWRYHLAKVLMEMGRGDAAIAEFRAAVDRQPDYADAHNDLGCALRDRGDMDQAVAELREAIRLKPDYAPTHSNLGNLLKDRGELDAAFVAYRQAMRFDPRWITSHQNLLYALNFHPDYDGAAILREHQAFDRLHAQPLAKLAPTHANDRSPDRRLRIGYVSPDFRDHVVGRNLLPLLRAHDHGQFEIACYALMRRHDPLTLHFQALADIWRDCAADTDEELADMIRRDRIDILVDLALHLDGNRLLLFARKPAPVQVTFAGYPGTTGLKSIDYRLTDPYLDPPGMNDAFYSEESIRLANCFWCYDPVRDSPIDEPHASGPRPLTFGCLNNFCKVNDSVLKVWSAVLRGCPDSRMVILAGAGSHRRRTLEALAVEPQRVEFVAHCPRAQYLELHRRLDVVLDTFPYNGHTTTCDALWMGVPVVTLAGKTAVGRGALSILSNAGLPELIADSHDEYVRIATELAFDLPRRTTLRSTLRQRMEKSPLMDAPRFAREVEAAYRQMWRRRCARQ